MITNPEAPTAAESAKLEQVEKWLVKRQAQVAASILRMGQVKFTDIVDTAGVRVTGSEVDLFFNRQFFSELKLVELTAVLLHESLHVVFRHQARAERITSNWDRRLFGYACEAVVNDNITKFFEEVELPGHPITGEWLIGKDTSDLSAEQVTAILRDQIQPDDPRFLTLCMDDHDLWDPDDAPGDGSGDEEGRGPAGGGLAPRWDPESDAIIRDLMASNPKSKLWGSAALGALRMVSRTTPSRTDLKRFLLEQLRPANRYATIWSKPNRKAMAIYPKVILPIYEPESWMVRVLMAIDSSGSVSNQFLSVAQAVANQHLPGTRIKMVSFDTKTYEVAPNATAVRGGGGTDAGAVERYIQDQLPAYPDYVFLFTDGFTPSFRPKYADRWVWLLPPHGSAHALPRGSRVYKFDPREMS